jgi:hypothetical protein
MIGHLYRYPHPHDPTRFIYVGQGAKRDQHHRVGRSSFGRRFKVDFPNIELPQPVRETIEIKTQIELNEMETIWMFQYHTWRGYPDGMNLVIPGAQDYKVAGKIGGPVAFRRHGNPQTKQGSIKGGTIAGRKNAESGHMSAIGKQYGGRYADVLDKFRTPEYQRERGIKGGKAAAKINAETGWSTKLGSIYGPENARKIPHDIKMKALNQGRHNRWHVKRGMISPSCNLCSSN